MVDCLTIALCVTDRNLLLILLFRNLTLKLMLKLQPLIPQLCEKWWHNSMSFLIITNYSQQNATFLEFIYFYRRCTCFRRFLRPSSGAHNCTYNWRYCQPILLLAATVDMMELSISSMVAPNSSIGWQYLKLYVQLCAPDDGWRNCLKHVERL
jgi:hypothetical protein